MRAARIAVGIALVGAILLMSPGSLDAFARPKADLLAMVGFAALAALAVRAFAPRGDAAAASGGIVFALLDTAVLAWCTVSAASAAFALSPHLAWAGEMGQREGLRTTLALAGVYAAARAATRPGRGLGFAHDAALVAAVVAGAYAMVQAAGHDPFAWSGEQFYPGAGRVVLRPGATTGSPLALGALLAPALALAVSRLAWGRGDRARLVPAAAVLGAALVATLSRGAYLAALVGVVAALAVPAALRALRSGRAAVGLAAAALPAALWAVVVTRAAFAVRVAERGGAESTSVRLGVLRGALALWRGRPWLGTGPDNFGLAFPRVQPPSMWAHEWIGQPPHAHSAALQVLATLGLAGALAGLAIVALVLAALVRALRAEGGRVADAGDAAAVFAALCVAGVFNPVGLAGATWFMVLAAEWAAPAAPGAAEAAAAPARDPHAARVANAALVAALAVALGVLAGAARAKLAGRAAARARAALEATLTTNDPRAHAALLAVAGDAAERATRHGPGEDGLWRLACDVACARADAAGGSARAAEFARAAEAAAMRALAIEPLRAVDHQRLAGALARRARAGAADALAASDAEFARARALAPADALVLADEARLELEQRRFTRAAATAARIVALYPRAAAGHALAAGALAALGERAAARREAGLALAGEWEHDAAPQRNATLALYRALGDGAPVTLSAPAPAAARR